MSSRGSILVVVEPAISPQVVVARAAWIARTTGCRLRMLLCDADTRSLSHRFIVSNEAREIAAQIRIAQETILDDLAATARDQGVEIDTEILEDRPISDGILQRALEISPTLIVKGTKYHSQAQRAVFVDTDWQLMRSLPFPLWLVKPHDLAAEPVIVAAVDPMHRADEEARLDRHIIGEARRVSDATGGGLQLVHTYEPLTGVGAEATRTFKPIQLPIAELIERTEKEHRQKLDALAASCGVDAGDAHQLAGRAREMIPWFARERKADLIVMGAVARGGAASRTIGSTAEKVLDDLPCDILIVKLPD